MTAELDERQLNQLEALIKKKMNPIKDLINQDDWHVFIYPID